MNSFRFFHLSGQNLLTIPENFAFEGWNGKTIRLRSYQREAAERILQNVSRISSRFGIPSVIPGGTVRFAPGTGKTLTSFCTAQFVSRLSGVKKVFFIVDQNDLDWCALRNYAAFSSCFIDLKSEIETLAAAISHSESVLIPTTFQKLEAYLRSLRDFDSFRKHTVFIYDECQTVVTGECQALISRIFPNSQHYFFTSFPTQNVLSEFFGEEIYSYSLTQALKEQNVLPFQIEYELTQNFTALEGIPEVDVILEARAMLSPKRIRTITRKILKDFELKSENQRFNSILAVNDVISVMNYYVELRRQLKNSGKKLKFAAFYDPNEDVENRQSSILRKFRELVTEDYNAQFHTNFSFISARSSEYLLDVSRRLTLGEIDLLLVMNHFLTGFSSTALNTLWVDRDLASGALLQVFSRTNRPASQKNAGKVVCFRNLSRRVKEVLPPEALI